MPDIATIPVSMSGITWTTVLVGVANLLIGGFGVAWMRSRPKMHEIDKTAEAKLIDALSARVDKLETALTEQRDHYERKLELLATTYDEDKRISRHELNNVKMRFKALVMLLKRLPEPPAMLIAILADIETMETEQMRAEALEKGARSGARVAAAEGNEA
jgi:DNA repair exonuclease SbcCD ATPase subunit